MVFHVNPLFFSREEMRVCPFNNVGVTEAVKVFFERLLILIVFVNNYVHFLFLSFVDLTFCIPFLIIILHYFVRFVKGSN